MAALLGDRWIPAYVGLGSNLGDPVRQVRTAGEELGQLPRTRLVALSHLYRNPPYGVENQPDYVNAAAGLLTQLEPQALLAELKQLEQRHGRTRTSGDRWAPRTLDLDLLVYGERELKAADLDLPHAGIRGRNFVLLPLLEIAPGLRIPGLGMVSALAATVDREGLVPVN